MENNGARNAGWRGEWSWFFVKAGDWDESRIYSYSPQMKMQSSQWKTWHISPIRRKATWKDLLWNQCWSSFLISKGLFGRNFYPKVRLWIQNITKVCWHDNAPCHTSFRILNFLIKHKNHMCESSSIFIQHGTNRFLGFPEAERKFERWEIRIHQGNSSHLAKAVARVHSGRFLDMFWDILCETMEELRREQWSLLWMR